MKKHFLILTVFCLFRLTNHAQIWQQTYGIPNHSEICSSIISDNENGYIMGIKHDYRTMWIVKADINGNMLWNKTLIDPISNFFIISSNCIDAADNLFVAGGEIKNDTSYGVLIKLNDCRELEWCHLINQNVDNYFTFVKTISNGNVRLLSYGASDLSGFDRYQLWEIDPAGNIKWEKQLMPGTQFYFQATDFHQMAMTSDGGSLCSGYTYYPVDTTNNPYWTLLQPCLVKCNNEGDMQWVYPPLSGADTNKIGFFDGCRQINNTYYAVGSDYNHTDTTLLPLVARFDMQGNMMSYHSMLPDTLNDQITNIEQATDTTLMLVSVTNQKYEDANHLAVFLSDTLGNYKKAFYRYDIVVGEPGDQTVKMRDNKFVLACESPLGYYSSQTDVVAIKLNANLEYDSVYSQTFAYDSQCPYPITTDTITCNCMPFVGVDKPVDATHPYATLIVAPNPASSYFTVEPLNMGQEPGTIQMYNIMGLKMIQVDATVDKKTSVYCAGWPVGIYMVRMQCGNKIVTTKVLIK